MISNNDGRALLERLEDVITGRIQHLANREEDLDEASVQSLANHYTAMKALEWFRDKHPAFFE